MTERTRLAVLAFLGLTLLAVITLSAGLDRLEFKPGEPFVGGGEAFLPGESVPGTTAVSDWRVVPFAQGVAAVIFVLLVGYLAVNLLRTVNPRQLIRIGAGLAAVLGLIWILSMMDTPGGTTPQASEFSSATAAPAKEFATTPLGEPPRSLVWLVILAVSAGGIGLGVWFFLRHRETAQPLDRLLEEAANAAQALTSGEEPRSVIIACYMNMTKILQEERGIERGQAVTPREFIHLLENMGLPAEPVRQLTGLFETVRYGAQPVSAQAEEQALECLNAIVAACREKVNP